MTEMEAILRGLVTLSERDTYCLYITASPRELILNKYRIYNR